MAEIKGIALGQLAMTEKELEEMEMGLFFLKLFYKNKADEENRKFYGELLRLQTMQLLNIQLDVQHKIKRVEDVWRMPWDNMGSVEELTEQERKERIRYLCELANKWLMA